MKAELVFHAKQFFEDGAIAEVVIWRVPTPVPPTDHGFKYRLFCGREGVRLVGYDNERGKGDHRHYGDREEPYMFLSVDQLLSDFNADVARVRRGDA